MECDGQYYHRSGGQPAGPAEPQVAAAAKWPAMLCAVCIFFYINTSINSYQLPKNTRRALVSIK